MNNRLLGQLLALEKGQKLRSMGKIKHWCFIIIGLALGVGCISNPVAGRPAGCSADGVYLTDPFLDDQDCGWYQYEDDALTGSARVLDGTLQVTSREPGQFWWSNPSLDPIDDVTVSAVARKTNGPDDNAFGLICRYQDPNNFYLFVISSDGYYAIGKVESGINSITYLSGEGEYQFTETIQQGVEENTIRATCEGDQLTLTVNGILLDSVEDNSFATGDVGVGLTAFEPGTATVEFDDIRVTVP